MLGQEIRKARFAAKLTQEELAVRAKISREYVSRLERNQYKPTVDVLIRLSAALGTKAWRIVRRIEERAA